MKLSYLWIALLVLPAISCKKDLQPVLMPDTASAKDYVPCSDLWVSNINCESSTPQFFFVYNNKYYAPQNAGNTTEDMQVHIFDGSSWTHIPSEVPFSSNHRNFAFVIGSKGYVARASTAGSRFYEYNFATNTWTRKADFPGTGMYGFATFTIGIKGYVAGGANYDGMITEVWEYNPASNTWRERADLPQVRTSASGFTLNGKGYLVNGMYNEYSGLHRSLMEYDPASNAWTAKSLFPGLGRLDSQVFVIGDNAYIGGGYRVDPILPFTDFYKYDPSGNTWTSVKDAPVSSTMKNGFSINGKGYAVYYPGDGQGAKLVKYYPLYCGPVVLPTN
jgi:hypothetical protein